MNSLIFPDINVWLAIATPEHIHAPRARQWWGEVTGTIAFCRFTQLGFLRLMTTAAAMDGKPLTMRAAWKVYLRLFQDDRVLFIPEPAEADQGFHTRTQGETASPKIWADAWLLAMAEAAQGTLLTFDRTLAAQGAQVLL